MADEPFVWTEFSSVGTPAERVARDEAVARQREAARHAAREQDIKRHEARLWLKARGMPAPRTRG